MMRLLDIILSSVAVLALAPLLVPIAIALRFSGEGEIFFKQTRVGRGGEYFDLYKFATMLKDSPHIGTGTVTLKDDPRVLPFGRILRKTKVNELPQLINVLRGDMSIIGPRPQTSRCFNAFPADSRLAITSVRPGLSGIGSIVFRGEEEILQDATDAERCYDEVIMPYKGRLEEWFVRKHSIAVYLKSILLTIYIVIRPSSAAVWRFFTDLPSPPPELIDSLRWSPQSD